MKERGIWVTGAHLDINMEVVMRYISSDELKLVYGGGERDCHPPKKRRGNNGFGNGGDDGVPGNSGSNSSPNADEKADDEVR